MTLPTQPPISAKPGSEGWGDAEDTLKRLTRDEARFRFHHPTPRRHPVVHPGARATTPDEKKRRKIAKASVRTNRKHANKKRRPTGSKKKGRR